MEGYADLKLHSATSLKTTNGFLNQYIGYFSIGCRRCYWISFCLADSFNTYNFILSSNVIFQVAEDVLGSVLCSPGCFSIYRASAVRDVLPTYASHVECAMDFLTKDMGKTY